MFNKERNHWIATHYHNGKVKVYDSCFYGSLSPSICEMLVHLYRSAVQGSSLVVTVMPIVQQRGSDDCGLFATGTAFQAASGLFCDLMQEELRQHLKVNFDNGVLTTHNFWEEKQMKTYRNKLFIVSAHCQPSITPWCSNVSNVTHGTTIR